MFGLIECVTEFGSVPDRPLQVSLSRPDVAASVRFFTAIGLTFEPRQGENPNVASLLTCPGLTMRIVHSTAPPAHGPSLWFRVPNLDPVFAAASAAGAEVVQENDPILRNCEVHLTDAWGRRVVLAERWIPSNVPRAIVVAPQFVQQPQYAQQQTPQFAGQPQFPSPPQYTTQSAGVRSSAPGANLDGSFRAAIGRGMLCHLLGVPVITFFFCVTALITMTVEAGDALGGSMVEAGCIVGNAAGFGLCLIGKSLIASARKKGPKFPSLNVAMTFEALTIMAFIGLVSVKSRLLMVPIMAALLAAPLVAMLASLQFLSRVAKLSRKSSAATTIGICRVLLFIVVLSYPVVYFYSRTSGMPRSTIYWMLIPVGLNASWLFCYWIAVLQTNAAARR